MKCLMLLVLQRDKLFRKLYGWVDSIIGSQKMPKFIYKAQNAQGLTITGSIEAKTYDEAMGILSL